MKVAVVIPTRNEAPTIGALTAVADAGLRALGGGALIVNADGGSDDGTGQAFLATPTHAPKRLLPVAGEPGKGRNLLAAWNLCLAEGVDAVVNLDGDMTSVRPWWIESFVGSHVDTTEELAWVAGAMAVFDALELNATLAFDNGWEITLDSGARLRFSRRARARRRARREERNQREHRDGRDPPQQRRRLAEAREQHPRG